MIDEKRTLALFGYTSNMLSKGSGKLIVVICDDCGKERKIEKRGYYRLHGEKKLCKACSRKGKKHWLYGKERDKKAKEKISITRLERGCNIGKKHSTKTKEKMSESKLGVKCSLRCGAGNGRWLGGVSFGKYCYKFNKSLKIKIREKYNNCDYISGIHKDICSKNSELSVYHVNYDKNCDCNGIKCKLIPLSRANHLKTNINRAFWNKLFIYALEIDKYYYNEGMI